jgi:succinate-semialdehyde dehydrogenase/glutarate-semialdehyde dehydrogenase
MTELQSVNPATGEVLASFPRASKSDVANVLEATDRAFRAWRLTPMDERAALVTRLGELLIENRDQLARLVTLEMGKVITEARGEVEKSAGFCSYYAEHAPEILASHRIVGGQDENWVVYDPMGPILAVMPWNFPFVQVFRFAPALLMAGNTIVLKHASNVPQCALRIADLFLEAGFPDDVFQTVLAPHDAIEEILSDDRVQAATLTGSEAAGSAVAATAGRELKRSVMELGGSDPFVVLEDADLDLASAAACRSRFSNNGQACINAKRFIVVEEVADRFEAEFVARVARLRVGDPLDDGTEIGPMASSRFAQQLREQVEDSVAAGAEMLTGSFDHDGPGAYVAPIVLSRVTPQMRVFHEETFGPVAAIIRAPDEAAAIELANETSYGLGASVWTADTARGRRVAERIEAGMVFVNEVVVSDVRLPFGGRKRSGFGRELGEWGIREFTEIKSIAISSAEHGASSATSSGAIE